MKIIVSATIQPTALVETEVEISGDTDVKNLEIAVSQKLTEIMRERLGAAFSLDVRTSNIARMVLRGKLEG